MIDASRSSQRAPLVAVVLVVITLVVHARVVLGGMTWDDVRYHTEVAPPRLAASEAMLAGEAPTWWDGTGLGVPLLAEPSHGAAYPLTWLAATPRLLDLLSILHLFWLALGVALWARRLGASELASVVAGALAAASGIAAATAMRGALPALAFVPWVCWAAMSLASARHAAHARRHAAVLGLSLGMIGLSGSLAIFIDAVVLAAALGLRAHRRWLGAAIAGGVAIAAAQWIAALAIAGDVTGATVHALKLSRLLELVVPGSFGAASGEHAVPQIAGVAPHLPSLFVGAPAFALAALARPSRRVIGVAAVLAILALVVGRGGGWPAWFGAPELHLAVLAVLALPHTAVGIDTLVEGERRALLAIAGAAVMTGLAVVAVAVLRSRTDAIALDRAVLAGAITIACTAAALVIAWKTDAAWTPLAIAAFMVAPSVGGLGSTAPAIARDVVDTAPMWADAAAKTRDPMNPLLPVRIYRPMSLYEEAAEISVADSIATLVGNAPSRYGLAAARSEDPARPLVHDRMWLAAAAAGGALLERYGIALAILPGSMVEGRGLVEVARRGQWALVKFPGPPAAAMVFEWIWIPDEAGTIARLFPPGASRGLPAGVTVLQGTGPAQQEEPREPESCTVSRWARGAIDMTCAATEPNHAVVSSTAMRGWTVDVDGKTTPWVTADVMRRAVALSAGPHVVSWRYQAPGLLAGFVIALAGGVALLALFIHALLRARGTDEN